MLALPNGVATFEMLFQNGISAQWLRALATRLYLQFDAQAVCGL